MLGLFSFVFMKGEKMDYITCNRKGCPDRLPVFSSSDTDCKKDDLYCTRVHCPIIEGTPRVYPNEDYACISSRTAKLRLCTVDGETGFFHGWYPFVIDSEENNTVTYGIIEFGGRVNTVIPERIVFCDETNAILQKINAKEK